MAGAKMLVGYAVDEMDGADRMVDALVWCGGVR